MLFTAFILGLAGSLHCAGMCSPLAFAVTYFKKSVWVNRLLYNGRRILTYGMLGAVVSTIGVALPIERFQSGLSIGLGGILILIGFVGSGRFHFPSLTKWTNKFTGFIKGKFTFLLQQKSGSSMVLLGVLNGLLPCGLTFVALTSCLILPTVQDGFYFMMTFGVGTLPVMLGFLSILQFLRKRSKLNFQRMNTIMLIAAASLLIARVIIPHLHPAPIPMTTSAIQVCP